MNRVKKLVLIVSLTTTTSFAGIPVIDAAALAEQKKHNIQVIAEWVKNLQEAQAQVTELKNQVNALTGDKGFATVLELGGIDKTIISDFESLLKGENVDLSGLSEKYLPNIDNVCGDGDGTTSSLCKTTSKSNLARLDFVEKLNNQIGKKLDTITELSKKISQARDMKSMSELQANISLEANSIALLQQQATNFRELNTVQTRLYNQRVSQQSAKNEWEAFGKAGGFGKDNAQNRRAYNSILGK